MTREEIYLKHFQCGEAQLRSFFAHLDSAAPRNAEMRIRVGRIGARLFFSSAEECERVAAALFPAVDNPADTADAAIRVWNGDFCSFMPPERPPLSRLWRHHSQWGEFSADKETGVFRGFSYPTNTQYLCIDEQKTGDLSTAPWHPLRSEIHRLTLREGDLFLHAAGVGIGGAGVLIAGKGGRGKSTTALSCLQAGFQYVADDYLIIDARCRMYPIYGQALLNDDSLNLLPGMRKLITDRLPNRPERALLDLSAYKGSFVSALPAQCVLMPQLTEGAPRVVPDPLAGGKMQLAVSTAKQISGGLSENDDFFTRIFARLKDLPSYLFLISKDPGRNCEVLREFILNLKRGKA